MIRFVLILSSWIIYIVKKLLGVNITISGDVPKKGSVLFLANHFTRFETFLVPYVLFSQHKRIARSLADDGVLVGWIGKYMKLAGSVSNKNIAKDCIIVDDLLSARADWIIYPEGHMVKNKSITFDKGEFCVHTALREGPVYTGAAVMALKTEILRSNAKLQEDANLQIVPLSITYYPIRPGENRLLLWIDKYFNFRGTHFFEELEIEINLLRHSNIHFHFSKPISVQEYIQNYLRENEVALGVNQTIKYGEWVNCHKEDESSLENDTVIQKLIDTQRKVIMNDVMAKVYGNIQINFDHIFILSLVTMPTLKVCPSYLKTLIYKNARELRNVKNLNLHPKLRHELFKLILDVDYPPFLSTIKLAQMQKILFKDSEGDYLFDKVLLEKKYDFNKVRVKNTLQMILNEIKWQKEIVKTAYENAIYSEKELCRDNFIHLQNQEWKVYEKEYLLYNDMAPLKDSVGAPIILYDEKNTVGLVFSHGYTAAPAEAKHLAEYFFDKGINVYVPRLSGHGTDPEALKHVSEKDWELDFERAFTAMRQVCDKVFIGGFSTGGLLALLHAAKYQADGVIAINSALKLNSLHVNYVVPSLYAFNEMISYLHAKGIKEWAQNDCENPNINYSKHPLLSIAQMEKVMIKTDKILRNITAPILVLQGNRDPVVDSQSAQLIYSRVKSKWKKLVLVSRDSHTIIMGKGETEVFESINLFIEHVLNSS